ncbi:MAG: DUF3021 domain-containing protein [Eubacterium sp.]|nr:DUF3021 domain-containing protein [Eubacterium sp.]
MLKRLLKLMGLGFMLSIIIGQAITMLSGFIARGELVLTTETLLDRMGSFGSAFLIQSILLGIYGMFVWGGIILYDLEKLPLMAATALHGALVIIPFIPLALFCGWTNGIVSVFIMSGCQLIGFIIIWLIMNAIYKKQVKELNELQKKLKEKQ